jgi:diguanylate cyclase (GGDEF)-like protein
VHGGNEGSAQPWWIGALAALLLVAGVILALRALTVQTEMHERYDTALALSQAALAAQHASGDLRTWQARNALELQRSGDRAVPSAELQSLAAAATELRARLEELAAMDMPREERARLADMRPALQRLERIGRNAAALGEGGAAVSRISLTVSAQEFDAFEHSLAALVSDTRARAAAAAANAERLRAQARLGLIGFTALIVLLALLLMWSIGRTQRANRALIEKMSRLAQQDGLTGIANRRTLDEAVPVEFARARRSGQPLTLVMIDLDHFKRYNDRRGHAAGDALLRAAAQSWARQLRPTDLLARYGGEEFTLVLPACTDDQAAQLVDRLRPLLPDRQTFSAGIATWDGDETPNELVQRADRALLRAKKSGRNRTMIAGRELQTTLPLEAAAAR